MIYSAHQVYAWWAFKYGYMKCYFLSGLILLLSFNSVNALPPDPTLLYCSYFGGSHSDDVSDMAMDEEGNIYICGTTQSLDLPTTPGAHQESFAGGAGVYDGFVAKFNDAYQLEWCTYFGGQGSDQVNSITYQNNHVYITGQTGSSTGISFGTSLDITLGGTMDCFVASFDATGELVWSTYFGGPGTDVGMNILVDNSNDVYVIGQTNSLTGIATDGAYQIELLGNFNAFLLKIDENVQIEWATYFGGSVLESGNHIEIDSNGFLYIAGPTQSPDGIAFGNSFLASHQGSNDCFISCFTNAGDLVWSTYYGGFNSESVRDIAIKDSVILLLGTTRSESGITFESNSYQPTYSGGTNDGFLLELSLEGDFLYSTYLGGTGQDEFWDIDVLDNSYYLTAQTSSPEQATADAFQQDVQGTYDALIMLFGLDHELLYSTYFGAGGSEKGIGISTQNNKTVLIGESSSIEGFTTANAEEPDYLGLGDIYLAAFDNLVGLSEKNAPLIQIFPNPCSDALMIQSDDLIKGISVFDATGRLVLQKEVFSRNAFRFDVHFLNDGIYSVLVRTEKEFFCEEILIVR
jgi:hypothetical protein